MTIQMKATEQYFPVVLFIILYKVVLNFESVDEIVMCDPSNESYRREQSFSVVQFNCVSESYKLKLVTFSHF